MPILQDLSQLRDLYPHRWPTFLGNAGLVQRPHQAVARTAHSHLLVHPRGRVLEGLAIQPARTPLGIAGFGDEIGLLEHLEMLGHRGQAHFRQKRLGEIRNAGFPGRQPGEDRAARELAASVEPRERVVGPADHQAEATFEAEDAAARTDVHVADAPRGELLGSADVVVVVAVAAVDDEVALFQVRPALSDRLIDGVARRPELNQPDGIHPNARGAAIIAELLVSAGRPLPGWRAACWSGAA